MDKTRVGKLSVDPTEIVLKHWADFKIEPLKGKDGLRTMERGCSILQKTGINYWISSGNLLGIYRDGKLIDHDTDIDVNVTVKWDSLQANILSKQVVLGLTNNDFRIIRTAIYHNHFMQLATMDLKTNVIFDVCFFYSGIVAKHVVYFDVSGYIEKPMKFVNTIDNFSFKGVDYPVPHKVEDFLAWKYGSDWRTPKEKKVAWQEEAPQLKKWR